MQEIEIHDALTTPKSNLVGKTINFNNWQAVPFYNFKAIIDWLNAHFEYTLTPRDEMMQFIILAALPLDVIHYNYIPAPQLLRYKSSL